MIAVLFSLSIIVSFFSPSSNATTAALDGDAVVLTSFFHGFVSSDPETMASWKVSNPICSWSGVFCDGPAIVSVDLSNLNISTSGGSIHLFGLRSLVNLSLAGNGLAGVFNLSDMPSLRFVNISGNEFEGWLDWNFSSLPSLEIIDAYDNNFTAALPLGVVELKNLRYLDLGGNFFYGNIPARYGSFNGLEYLQLAGNNLRGKIPGELGNLTSLKELYLGYYNTFSGGIPPEIGDLSKLAVLDLSSCDLDGEIPARLGNLAALETLFLHSNLLSGEIPASVGNLSGLTSLDLSNNELSGEIPPELGGLRRLTLLNLFMNKLHGSIPASIASLPVMETLGLFMNNLTGTLPENLGSGGSLRLVDLSSNKLTGTIPDSLCSSNHLKVLILMNNFLFGSIPRSLENCLTLVRVRIGQNYLNGSIPPDLLYLPLLNLLELQNNFLSDSILKNSNRSRSQLTQLNLSNNLLSGELSSLISNLFFLQKLLLSGNRFTGKIPPEIGELRRLEILDISRNSLSGEIPPEIGNCSQLTYLDLSRNNLSGEIPAEIAEIGVLNYLNLSKNHLINSIPSSIGAMKSLTEADFSFNNLSGWLPESGQFIYFNASSFAGNPMLCGPALKNLCNFLPPPHKVVGDARLAMALSLLLFSVAFAGAAALAGARANKLGGDASSETHHGSWKLTTFQQVDFAVDDVVGCMKDSNVIGRGGAGVVYVCRTSGGAAIAVKKLPSSCDDDHGFRSEIKTLGSIRHRNIVRLLAFCSNSESNALVYEYMSNGSLGEVLHGNCGGGFLLNWRRRYKIAIDAARGLCYLHHDCKPMIVHRDVKSNNILLDGEFEAHVADFGLAKFLHGGSAATSSESMSAIAGSYGYIAPEYAYTLKVDEKSDVYSFGVVVLELITGRRPVGEPEFGDGVDIVQWARRITGCNKDGVFSIIDPRITSAPAAEATHAFFVSMMCVHENSVERPTMREVVQMLLEYPNAAVGDGQSPPGSSPTEKPSAATAEGNSCYRLCPDLLT